MRALKFSENKLKFVIDTFLGLITKIENDEVRGGVNKLMYNMGERLFEAPASPNLAYHNCCVGGLAEHSLRVYKNLRILVDQFGEGISHNSIVLVSLFHDLGKVGSIDASYYIEQDSQWHKDRGVMYEQNPKLSLSTAQRSLRIFGQFNIPLTSDEYLAILLHDGMYVSENKSYAHKEGKLGLLLHQADMLACMMEREKWENIQ